MRQWEGEVSKLTFTLSTGKHELGSRQSLNSKLCNMQVAEQNGHGGGEDNHSIALSLPYTQRAQRELRVSKQQVRPTIYIHCQRSLHCIVRAPSGWRRLRRRAIAAIQLAEARIL